jgi:heme/copper-type cytochrome/quinol oxidase subunit 3
VNHTAVAAEHPETSTGLPTWKVGFWTLIGSETLFFGSLISTYMVYKGKSVVGPYPADVFSIPLTTVSTFVLLMSSLSMVLALSGFQKGDRKGSLIWLGATIGMGMIFLGFQAYEFTHFAHQGLTLSTNLFGSSFYLLTGFHGAHVMGGVIWLIVLWVQALRGQIGGPKDALKVEIAGLYWHFVDIVWIVIFTFIYLLE